MDNEIEQLLKKHDLTRIKSVLKKYILPCVAFNLKSENISFENVKSKVGGEPDLPDDFIWSENKGRPLDFLLQINLSEASKFDGSGLLPKEGVLSFFYDLENQSWGYDPNDLDGYKVVYSPSMTNLRKWNIPNEDFKIDEFELDFQDGKTVPHVCSMSYELLEKEAEITKDEWDNYWDFADEFARKYSVSQNSDAEHHLLGHAKNIQGDMQTEAQLVMNGYYCGRPFEDEDPERERIKENFSDWILLLQLDSDDTSDFMWGDAGMLYYWIRKEDLIQRNFGKVWMTLQCH